jgi:hypothetical protein
LAEFTTAAAVKDYISASGTTGQWSNALIGSNIIAASGNLQRWTNRQFEPQGSNTAVTKTFSTRGRAYMTIPDLQSASAVVHNDSTLTADETYYLLPDRNNTGVYTGIQLPSLRDHGNYRSHRDWFDRNLDHWHWSGRMDDIPNDLTITGVWGHNPYPPELEHATKVLAAWYTVRPDSKFGAVAVTPGGAEIDISQMPAEVREFVRTWKLGDYD